ncbi:MAG: hypothetical protein ACKOSS_02800 [Planctomycetia bacterium]
MTRPRRLPLLLASLALALPACAGGLSGSDEAAAPALGTPAGTPAGAPPVALAPKPGRIRGSSAYAPEGGVFDFGGGRRVLALTPGARAPEPEPEPEGQPLAEEPAVAPGRAGAATPAPAAGASPAAPAQPTAPDAPLPALTRAELATVAARGVRITWEALAVERDQILNPRTPAARRTATAVQADSKIILVSDDHPAAHGKAPGSAVERAPDGSQVAVVASEDLRLVVRGLREAGFFQVARPTEGVAALFASEDARGRVTVEVDGATRTLLSMRGQGMQAATRDIPRIYSQAKQSVAALKNRAPSLSVVTTGNAPARPRPRLSRAPNRTLTPEEAASVLGEDMPGEPPAQAPLAPPGPLAPRVPLPRPATTPAAAPPTQPASPPPAPPPDDTWGLGR